MRASTSNARALLCGIAAAAMAWSAAAAQSPPIEKQRVTFKSGGLTLVGYLFKPQGNGPFAAIIWNHGSEQNPGGGPQFDSAAAVFLRGNYVLFAPVRRGHVGSEGKYIVDERQGAQASGGAEAANRLTVRKLETEQLDDQLAGLAYLRALPFVDTTRLGVAGCSYGGIQTLLGAEAGAGYKAAFSISPAALSWENNPLLRTRLIQAVGRVRIPVMIIQPPKDASLEPIRVLGAEFKRLNKPYTGKVYPAEGPEDQQTHCFGGAKGMHIWADDALAFFQQAFAARRQ